ncbi:MAG TPA: hypothetical protein DCS82_02260 [Rhodospirillaceae bacterium]|nr:hypothetical protein [Rhodospirillaceae bacterium]HAA92244.1 hypothetical protein [Rhodospirillaceae bacterium]HAT34512.1 hypothetical protein [Rhodospirillaceae bacterium]|tara:strand:- start:41 stop:430 length:390 start_codon:yes stop_codon:yes gene_type:complete
MKFDLNESEPHTTPVLFSSDLKRAAAFYEGILGFRSREDRNSLVLSRNNLRLRVIETDDPGLMSNTGVMFHVDNFQNLYEELSRHSQPQTAILTADAEFPPQFSLYDPDGNTLYFADKSSVAPYHTNPN